jgi:short-subunit dehydrogenase
MASRARNAVITGGSGGIGKTVFAVRGAGRRS